VRRIVLIVLTITLLLWLPVAAVALDVGQQAPEFNLRDLSGKAVSLSDFKGRIVLLKLATTWCPTCHELSREISKTGDFLKKNNVVLLEVFIQDAPDKVEHYIKDFTAPMEHYALIDEGQVHEKYRVYMIPRFLVIDPGQAIFFDSLGRNVTAQDIERLVNEAAAVD